LTTHERRLSTTVALADASGCLGNLIARALVENQRLRPGVVRPESAGDTLNFRELVAAYQDASGKSLTLLKMSSLADLDAEIARRQQADPKNMFAYMPLMYCQSA
jgi:hypothetical protein